jgi:hypothetical protein
MISEAISESVLQAAAAVVRYQPIISSGAVSVGEVMNAEIATSVQLLF